MGRILFIRRTSALIALAVSVLFGCEERKLTEGDCLQVKDRLQRAWHRDAIAALHQSERDEFRRFVGDEGDRIGKTWMDQCVLSVGRPVSEEELGCLSKADTIDDVYECAPR